MSTFVIVIINVRNTLALKNKTFHKIVGNQTNQWRADILIFKGLAEQSEKMGNLLRGELSTLPNSIVKQVLITSYL